MRSSPSKARIYTMAASKVMPLILLCIHMMAEMDVGGTAVEVESS